MRRVVLAVMAFMSLALPAAAAAAPPFPAEYELPDGWRPEGIASGNGNQLFVGSIPTGDIIELDARTGEVVRVIDAPDGSAAVGIEVAGDELWVAGGGTGRGFVYDLGTGEQIEALTLTSAPTFVNDVTLTPQKAYFTDSQRMQLYVVDRRTFDVETLALSGIAPAPMGQLNLNGIEDARGGRYLLAVQTGTETLWRIDARDGSAVAVDLGGYRLTNGDGLLLEGNTLYVVQNRLNQVAVIKLGGDLTSGRVVETIQSIASGDFAVPTTIARIGNRLYLPNARFGVPSPDTAEYAVFQVPR